MSFKYLENCPSEIPLYFFCKPWNICYPVMNPFELFSFQNLFLSTTESFILLSKLMSTSPVIFIDIISLLLFTKASADLANILAF